MAGLKPSSDYALPTSACTLDPVDVWRVGNVVVTKVVDLEIPEFDTQTLFDGLTNAQVSAVDWLQPHYATPEGAIKMSFHAYIIETQGRRVIVDTCVGNDKARLPAFFNQLSTPFLDRLAAAGFKPRDIDMVLCTHMHVDHVGWNARWTGSAWVPTFPNAQYLFGRVEWNHWLHEVAPKSTDDAAEVRRIMEDSVTPIVAAGLHRLIETNHRINDEIRLFPTPGHTPGHVSVAITSQGQRAVITGDVIHHPIQLVNAAIQSNFDTDRALAEATRRAFIDEHGDKEILVLGTHFARPSGGWIVRDGVGWRFASSPRPMSSEATPPAA